MKHSCEIIKDLLPLYHDEVCSEESKEMVEEHLEECTSCKGLLTKMENHIYDDSLTKEREHVVQNYSKKIKRKSATIGIALASILMIPIIICLIVNIATGHALDWFFIVLTSLMLFASMSVVPLLVEEKKLLWTFASSFTSLMLLLLTCCLYTQGDWLFVTMISITLGVVVVVGPYVSYQLPLKGKLASCKGILCLLADTLLLYLLLLICGFYLKDALYWESAFLIATPCVLLLWVYFGIIRYTKLDSFLKAGICTLLAGVFTSLTNGFVTWVLEGTFVIRFTHANLTLWVNDMLINANVEFLILITAAAIGGILIVFGLVRMLQKK